MIKILLADDHEIVRSGIRRLLETEEDFEIAGEASNGRELITLCTNVTADVVLLDLDMPELDGLAALPVIRGIAPDLKVVVLTMHDNEEYAARAIKNGALGYILKASSTSELPTAIRDAAQGKKHISAGILQKMAFRRLNPDNPAPLATLSDRELQILRQLAQGYRLNRISTELGLSVSAVATYKKRLMEKLGLEKNSDIIHFAIKHNLNK